MVKPGSIANLWRKSPIDEDRDRLARLKLVRPLLSLRNLLRRQLTFQHSHDLLGTLIALPRCQQQPLVSLHLILRHALALFVADDQSALSQGEILFGGFAKPFRRLHRILRHARALVVADAQIELSLGVILPSGLAKPFHRLHLILWHALAVQVAEAELILSLGVILLGGFAIPFYCLHLILCHAFALVVAKSEFHLGLCVACFCLRLHFLKRFLLKLVRPLLSLRNLLRPQRMFQQGHALLGMLIALPHCQQQPLVSLDQILRHAFAAYVADAQIFLRRGVILFGGFAIPFHRLHVILRHAFAVCVAGAQDVLRLREILLGGFAIPFYRLHRILRHAEHARALCLHFILRHT